MTIEICAKGSKFYFRVTLYFTCNFKFVLMLLYCFFVLFYYIKPQEEDNPRDSLRWLDIKVV